MSGWIPRDFVKDALTNEALTSHLVRAARGMGRWFPWPGGGRAFACDLGGVPEGCPVCEYVNWPDGNPLDEEL
jgi:hypothetical protein